MSRPQFTIDDLPSGYRRLKFDIPGVVTTPEEFAHAVAELGNRLAGALPVLITGKGPIWGYGMLIHAAHPTPAVAVYDPRLSASGSYIVVQTHSTDFALGQVISNPEEPGER